MIENPHPLDTDDRHANPSGLAPEERKAQPVPTEHHEEGHESPDAEPPA